MPVSDGFNEFVADLLANFGQVTIRNMFGRRDVRAPRQRQFLSEG
jgi:TfoX/Sxy family transcriptional regulator of competence genes